MRIRIQGKAWNLRFAKSKELKRDYGHCDSPKRKSKEIVIRDNLDPKVELDTTIHELLHAADWSKSEEWVDSTANEIATILWRLNWRKVDQ